MSCCNTHESKSFLSICAAAAAAMGLSYGKYMALLYEIQCDRARIEAAEMKKRIAKRNEEMLRKRLEAETMTQNI